MKGCLNMTADRNLKCTGKCNGTFILKSASARHKDLQRQRLLHCDTCRVACQETLCQHLHVIRQIVTLTTFNCLLTTLGSNCTQVLHKCCINNNRCLWRITKFELPIPSPNPITDNHQKLHMQLLQLEKVLTLEMLLHKCPLITSIWWLYIIQQTLQQIW